MTDWKRVAGAIEAQLRAEGTGERAEHEKAYLKSSLEPLKQGAPFDIPQAGAARGARPRRLAAREASSAG